ncbi:ParA family protein [Candidatus Saccharibacteria bacterium]|nr:ParA family protein [Candidatus Saccharibacteria bacterium]
MAKIICITNQKGGVGKTTTAVNVSYYLAKSKFRVLLIDIDPQGNSTSGLGIDKSTLKKSMTELMVDQASFSEIIVKTKYKNLDLAPTTPELSNAEVEMTKLDSRFTILKKRLKFIQDSYDYIIIDSPPSLSLLTVNAMISSNFLLLPVQTEFYALEGVAQLLESMKLVKKVNPDLKLLGVVATMFDRRTSLSTRVLAEIQKYFKSKVFETVIPRNVRIAEAPSHAVPVGDYDHFSKGARAYRDLTKEIIERTKGQK